MSTKNFKPDQSFYLAHFTSERPPIGEKEKENPTISVTKNKTAYEKLVSILTSKKIIASTLPWNKKNAVCLTECPWTSLLAHANNYSPYGIGFNKAFIFGTGGAPAFYVRADYFDKQQWADHIYTFVTPFWPPYRPKSKNKLKSFKNIDYTHEREWRVPHDLTFEYDDVDFVVVNTYEDMAKLPKEIKDSIGREKFLIMDNYRTIEKLWPVHNLGE